MLCSEHLLHSTSTVNGPRGNTGYSIRNVARRVGRSVTQIPQRLLQQQMEHSHSSERRTHQQKAVQRGRRAVLVNGPRLQELRLMAGMTQEELAAKSGFSDRLIRKAEASEPLRMSTISQLAQALSAPYVSISASDLVISHDLIVAETLTRLFHSSHDQVRGESSFLHADVKFSVTGEQHGIPFAGTYCQQSGVNEFRSRLNRALRFGTKEICISHFFSAAGDVAAHTETVVQSHLVNSEPQTIWWFARVGIIENSIQWMHLFFDTGSVMKLLNPTQS